MLFKVSYEKEIHILKSVNAKSLHELKALIPKVFKQHPNSFYLTYLDEDSDQITLATEADYSILVGCGVKSAKILIREKSEDFYDETQQIELEEEPKEIEALIEKDSVFNEASEIQSNANQSIDESIEEKLRNMLPGLITKIKTEVEEEIMSQSKLSEASKSTFEEKKSQVIHPYIICDGCSMKYIVGNRYKCSVCHDYDLCEKCEAASDHPHPFLKIKNPKQKPFKIIVVMEDDNDSLEVNGNRQPMDGLSELIQQGLNFTEDLMKGMIPKKEEKKEEKKVEEKKEEKKVEPKIETKPEPTVEKKVPRKVEEKKEEKVQEKKEQKVEEKKEEKVDESRKKQEKEQRIVENANYLSDLMNINFTKAYKFSQIYHKMSKEELLNLYLTQLK